MGTRCSDVRPEFRLAAARSQEADSDPRSRWPCMPAAFPVFICRGGELGRRGIDFDARTVDAADL